MSDQTPMRDRMDGDYEPPVLAEPAGGPVPPWSDPDAPPQDVPALKARD